MLTVIQSALENGLIYSLVALALYLSYTTLDIADMTTDGSFTLGCATAAAVCLLGHPILALPAAMLAGAAAGGVTALLQTKLGVPSILAGIITNFGLYSVNLTVMGGANVNLFRAPTIFKLVKETGIGWSKFVTLLPIVLLAAGLLVFFLGTRLGLSIRATGDNRAMVRASSINPAFTVTVGLCAANALTALSGGLIVQYGNSGDMNLGVGMVVMGLASLIIGQTIFGRGSVVRDVAAVLGGSLIYRLIFAAALEFNVPATYMKLLTAVIVAASIAAPSVRRGFALQRRKLAAGRKGGR